MKNVRRNSVGVYRGDGSLFRVRLPRDRDPLDPDDLRSPNVDSGDITALPPMPLPATELTVEPDDWDDGKGRKSILIVDDNPELRDFLGVRLSANYRVMQAENIEGLQHGAEDFLAKPFDPSELAARIAGILASRQRLGEHLRRQQEKRQDQPSRSESFEQRVRRTIVENLGDGTFTVQDLASALALDRTALFRKVRDRFGQSSRPEQSRLQRAQSPT